MCANDLCRHFLLISFIENNRNKIDYNQNIGTKLIITSKYRDQNSVFDFYFSKDKDFLQTCLEEMLQTKIAFN